MHAWVQAQVYKGICENLEHMSKVIKHTSYNEKKAIQ